MSQEQPDPILDNYVLLVVVMSLFVGGTLVVLSGVLLLCKRCWDVHRRFNRCAHSQQGPGRLGMGGIELVCMTIQDYISARAHLWVNCFVYA